MKEAAPTKAPATTKTLVSTSYKLVKVAEMKTCFDKIKLASTKAGVAYDAARTPSEARRPPGSRRAGVLRSTIRDSQCSPASSSTRARSTGCRRRLLRRHHFSETQRQAMCSLSRRGRQWARRSRGVRQAKTS